MLAAQAHKPILRTMTDAPPHTLRAAPVHSPHFPKPLFFETRRDHFNITDTTKWQQAYYVNATFWTPGSGAPVFLCVGGEGPALDGSVVVSSVHCNNAVEWLSETRALMFAVEHRYYGCHNMSACPYSPSDEKLYRGGAFEAQPLPAPEGGGPPSAKAAHSGPRVACGTRGRCSRAPRCEQAKHSLDDFISPDHAVPAARGTCSA